MLSTLRGRTPQVSLLVPVYNGARYLKPTVESLLGQDFEDFELIFVDDGSTDDSLKLLKSFRDPRIRIIAHESNRGVSEARNTLLDAAKGELWAFSAQDDVSRADRLTTQIAHLEAHPEVKFIGTAVEFIDAESAYMDKTVMPLTVAAMRWFALFEAPCRHSTLMVRADWARELGLRYESPRRMNSDFYFVLQLLHAGDGYNLPETLVQYRLHGHNASRVRRKEYLDTGAELALATIRREFPEFDVSLAQITALRKSQLGMRLPHDPLSLADIKVGTELYCDLQDAFREKYPEHTPPQKMNPESTIGGKFISE